MYVIELADGYYLQERGGYDWGRAEWPSDATHYDSPEDAAVAQARLRPGRAIVCEDTGAGVVPVK